MKNAIRSIAAVWITLAALTALGCGMKGAEVAPRTESGDNISEDEMKKIMEESMKKGGGGRGYPSSK